MKKTLFLPFALFLCLTCFLNSSNADEATLVQSLFDFLYDETALPNLDLENSLAKAMPDVVAVLGNMPRYQESKTPILKFLRDERDEIFHSTSRKRIVVFSPAQVMPVITSTEKARFVHVLITWDRSSPTPPVKIAQFCFNNGQLVGPPTIMASSESKTIYDFALDKKNSQGE